MALNLMAVDREVAMPPGLKVCEFGWGRRTVQQTTFRDLANGDINEFDLNARIPEVSQRGNTGLKTGNDRLTPIS
jgi:hypothetical protein